MNKKLIVLKVGTSSLTGNDGSLSKEKVRAVCGGVADLRDRGHSVIIVTSGSIAAGFRRLGYSSRPTVLAGKQAAAAVGQGLLMQEYESALAQRGYAAAQILLTPDAFTSREKYRNAFNTLELLIRRGAVAVINENDTVATAEIRFGDNDTLSAQVAGMVHADRLILLTDVDGLYTGSPGKDKNARRIDEVSEITPEIEAYAAGSSTANGTGGMKTKLSAAKLATAAGVEVFICSSKSENAVTGALDGTVPGTLFRAGENLKTRLQWMAFYAESAGSVTADQGAVRAVTELHKSLLPAGVCGIEGDFRQGDVVDILNCEGERVARGYASYSAACLRRCIEQGQTGKPVIHIDNMVVIAND